MNQEQDEWTKRQMNGMEVIKTKDSKNLKEIQVYKYSNKGKGQLKESCIIAGKPYFLKYSDKKDHLGIEPYIEEETRKLIPPYEEEYPYEPYIFTDVREPNYCLQRTKKETIDSLYQRIKSVVGLYNDIDEKTLNLFSADILASYFQDRFSTVHYLIIVGDNGTGKSAIADTFDALGYRTVVMTNPTRAIWYRVLGDIEFGQVTIVADESEGIEQSLEIMSILKDGYQTKHKVPRMDSDNKKPEWYYPFCFKIIICENSPTEYKAKGLLDRSFKIKTYKGFPKYDIKEIRNPQGNKIRQKQLDEIEDLRKLLLVFKLYHRDPLAEIDIGINGRDKELCKPLLQLFFNTESQKEIEETLQYFIDIKNERKKQSLEAQIYPILVNVISEIGNRIQTRRIWDLIIANFDGQIDEKNESLFYSSEYGKIYINKITKIICDKFGAENRHERDGNVLVFNKEYLTKMHRIYGTTEEIQTKLVECEPCEPCEPPWKSQKSCYIPIHSKNSKDSSTDLPEIISLDPESASHDSHDSQEYPHDCYYCGEYFDGVGKEAYQRHVLSAHPEKPCYPGLAEIKKLSLHAKGMWWEV